MWAHQCRFRLAGPHGVVGGGREGEGACSGPLQLLHLAMSVSLLMSGHDWGLNAHGGGTRGARGQDKRQISCSHAAPHAHSGTGKGAQTERGDSRTAAQRGRAQRGRAQRGRAQRERAQRGRARNEGQRGSAPVTGGACNVVELGVGLVRLRQALHPAQQVLALCSTRRGGA